MVQILQQRPVEQEKISFFQFTISVSVNSEATQADYSCKSGASFCKDFDDDDDDDDPS